LASISVASGETLAVRRGLVWLFLLFPYFGAVREADAQGGIGDSVSGRTAYAAETEFPGDISVGHGNSLDHVGAYTVARTAGGTGDAAGGGASTLIPITKAATSMVRRKGSDFSKSLCEVRQQT
jgi:hypothetical protein